MNFVIYMQLETQNFKSFNLWPEWVSNVDLTTLKLATPRGSL